MLAKPDIAIAWDEEIFTDEVGQRWIPGRITLEWPAPTGLRSPSVTVQVIALARADMTREQLEDQHLQAVRDVLSAAVLAVEEPIYQSILPLPVRAVDIGR
jgi:hypothetical protein